MNDSDLLFKKGDTLIATGTRGLSEFTLGKEYTCIEDSEAGIFADRPFVTVSNDKPDSASICHQSRFTKKESANHFKG